MVVARLDEAQCQELAAGRVAVDQIGLAVEGLIIGLAAAFAQGTFPE